MMNRDEFRDLYCMMCGSQRCDASDEMMNECHHFIDERAQGICRECFHLYWCQEARRWLNMLQCSEFFSADVLKW